MRILPALSSFPGGGGGGGFELFTAFIVISLIPSPLLSLSSSKVPFSGTTDELISCTTPFSSVILLPFKFSSTVYLGASPYHENSSDVQEALFTFPTLIVT